MTETQGRPSHRALFAVGISLLAALFFTLTYVLNRANASADAHWAWIASLRYLITLPLLLPLVLRGGGFAPVWRSIRAAPWPWLLYAGIGFFVFYASLSYAAASGPSWLVAGSFQFTVIAGMLCAPLLYRDARRRIPLPALAAGVVIVAGVLLMQFGHAHGALDRAGWIALGCVLVSAVAYPLGNRLLLLHLERTGERLDATQRVFGLTLASQPLWWALAAFGWTRAGWPEATQVWLAAGVALSAGVVATVLFFRATGMVREHATALAAAEAMQAAEVLFATLLGVAFLGESWPRGMALWGALLVIGGIGLFAWVASRPVADARETEVLRTEHGT